MLFWPKAWSNKDLTKYLNPCKSIQRPDPNIGIEFLFPNLEKISSEQEKMLRGSTLILEDTSTHSIVEYFLNYYIIYICFTKKNKYFT
jgi:hypothetical protein